MKKVPQHARSQHTPTERAAYRRRLTRVSPAEAAAIIGPEDYELFNQFQAAVEKMRAEERKKPGKRDEEKLVLYRQKAAELSGQLYERHRRLVYATVNKYLRRLISNRTVRPDQSTHFNAVINWVDLVQEGCTGLLRALEDFVPLAGNRFSTYARYWIYQAISRPVMASVGLCSNLNPMLTRLKQAREKLTKVLERSPADEELAREAGLSQQQLLRALKAERRAAGAISLDGWFKDHGDVCDGYGALLSEVDRPDMAAIIDQKNLKSELRRAFKAAGLKKRHQAILEERFGLNGAKQLTLAEIGKRYGITRERVRQIITSAFKKLVSGEAREILEPYQYLLD